MLYLPERRLLCAGAQCQLLNVSTEGEREGASLTADELHPASAASITSSGDATNIKLSFSPFASIAFQI